jgi:hypothetical protein
MTLLATEKCQVRAPIAMGLLLLPRGLPGSFAFSASLSQRNSKVRLLAATSGELASLARRAHSAA